MKKIITIALVALLATGCQVAKPKPNDGKPLLFWGAAFANSKSPLAKQLIVDRGNAAYSGVGDSTGIVVTDAARLSSLSTGQGGVIGLVAGIVAGEVAGAVSRNHKYADDDVLVDLHQPARVLFVDHPDVDKHYISIRLTVKYTDAIKTFKQRDLVKIVKLDNGDITIAKYE